jgi:hypothetical protein
MLFSSVHIMVSRPNIPQRPAHSCKHCQRIVIRREHIGHEICRIQLLHITTNIRKAVKDGFQVIAMFFGMSAPTRNWGRLTLPKLPRLWKVMAGPDTRFPSICRSKVVTFFMCEKLSIVFAYEGLRIWLQHVSRVRTPRMTESLYRYLTMWTWCRC